MAGLCLAPATGAGFLTGTLAHLDCQAQTIGDAGYQALASAGSPVSLALTGLLTVFVAIFGVRMLLGQVPSISDLTLAVLKIGFVLLLATSWPAYRIIAYDLVLKGPSEIFGQIGQASGLPGSDGGLVSRLQAIDDGVLSLVSVGSGRTDIAARVNPADSLPVGRPVVSDDTAFGISRTMFVAGIIGAFGMVRLFGGLLLAIGPLFGGLLLFEATRSFFAGWLRSLLATGLGSLTISLVLSVELAILEPWLGNVLALRAARLAALSAPFELMAISIGFSVILFGAIAACVRLSFAGVLGRWARANRDPEAQPHLQAVSAPNPLTHYSSNGLEAPSRAFLIAESVASVDRHHASGSGKSMVINGGQQSERVTEQMRNNDAGPVNIPLGQTYRRTSRRVSAVATRRSARV